MRLAAIIYKSVEQPGPPLGAANGFSRSTQFPFHVVDNGIGPSMSSGDLDS